MLLFFSQKVTNIVNTCANCLFRVRSDGRVVRFVSVTVFQPLCTVFDNDRSFKFRGLKLILKTLSSFGEEGIKPVEIKETRRVKCSLLNVERTFHGKIT